MITTILFDLDGVLLDAKEIHYEALNEALKRWNYSEISRKDHLGIFDGLPTRVKLEMLGIEKRNVSHICATKQEITIELIEKKIFPLPKHFDLFDWFEDKKYKVGCCTNSVRETLIISLKALGLCDDFEVLLSNQDVEKPKPDPEIYLSAMEILSSKPKETLIIEDNFNGIQAARASGAFVLEVSGVEEVNLSNIKRKIEEIDDTKQD